MDPLPIIDKLPEGRGMYTATARSVVDMVRDLLSQARKIVCAKHDRCGGGWRYDGEDCTGRQKCCAGRIRSA